MFITALFTIVKWWKQSKCPSTSEWINKMWCIYPYTKEYQPSLKGKEILTHSTTWINLVDIMLSETSQSQKDEYCMSPLSEVPRADKFIETEGWGRGGMGD